MATRGKPDDQPGGDGHPRVRAVALPSPEILGAQLRDAQNLRTAQLTRIAAEMDRIVGYVQTALPNLARDPAAVSRVTADELVRLRDLARSYLHD